MKDVDAVQLIKDFNTLQLKWNRRFLAMADGIAEWSKDPSTRVGCIIFDPASRAMLPSGYNGFPRHVNDDPKLLNDRPIKLQMTVHAELNALLNCAKHGVSTNRKGAAVSLYPCAPCAGSLVQAGIITLVTREPDWNHERWGASFAVAADIFKQAAVSVHFVTAEESTLVQP